MPKNPFKISPNAVTISGLILPSNAGPRALNSSNAGVATSLDVAPTATTFLPFEGARIVF